MRVFISWSGTQSGEVAEALGEWLPHVIQAVVPWVSSHDIRSGDRWFTEIATQLEAHDYGLLCLTPSNLESPWIHFEAGALAKSVARGRIVPLLHGVRPSDLDDPLKQFNAETLDRAGVERLVRSMNDILPSPLADHVLAAAFAANWDSLHHALSLAGPAGAGPRPSLATIDAKLDELLARGPATVEQRTTSPSARPVPRAARAVRELEELLSAANIVGFRDKRAFRRFLVDVDSLEDLPVAVLRKTEVLLADGWTVETRSGRHSIFLDHESEPIKVYEPFLFPSMIRSPH